MYSLQLRLRPWPGSSGADGAWRSVRPQRPARAVVLSVVLCACGAQSAPDNLADSGAPGASITGMILVSAAASLTDAFAEVEAAFEAAHPGVDVVLNLGGSGSLRTQILEGAPVDVFASADMADTEKAARDGLVSGEPRIFAGNSLQVAVPKGNPGGVEGLEAFADPSLRLGLCAQGVPCGDLARTVLARAGVVPSLDTEEPDVRALLTKIELGELDAGITYLTDVASAGGSVWGLDIPADLNVMAAYPIAVLAHAPNPRGADAFVRFILSDEGRSILSRFGFTRS